MTTRPPSTSSLVSLGLWSAILTFALDQAHKLWMLHIYRIEEKRQVAVTPFFDWVYVVNKGISYGMFQQSGTGGQYALATFAVLVSIGLAIWLARGVDNKILAIGVGLLIGGALGNALDRVLHGGVLDFYLLHAFGYQWYVFNTADIAIVAGVLALLYDSWRPSRDAPKPS
jgi:signal peptidase II